jgi:hypothetical protein
VQVVLGQRAPEVGVDLEHAHTCMSYRHRVGN